LNLAVEAKAFLFFAALLASLREEALRSLCWDGIM
jgi:hypothetical protein